MVERRTMTIPIKCQPVAANERVRQLREDFKKRQDHGRAKHHKKIGAVKLEDKKRREATQEKVANVQQNEIGAVVENIVNINRTAGGNLATRGANINRRDRAKKTNFFSLTTAARNLYYKELNRKEHKPFETEEEHEVTYKERDTETSEKVKLSVIVGNTFPNGFRVEFTYRNKIYAVVPNEKIALLVTQVVSKGGEKLNSNLTKAKTAVFKAVQYNKSLTTHIKKLKDWNQQAEENQVKDKDDAKGQLRVLRRAKTLARMQLAVARAQMRTGNAKHKASKACLACTNVENVEMFPLEYDRQVVTKQHYTDVTAMYTEAIVLAVVQAKTLLATASVEFSKQKASYKLEKGTKRAFQLTHRPARARKKTTEVAVGAITAKTGEKKAAPVAAAVAAAVAAKAISVEAVEAVATVGTVEAVEKNDELRRSPRLRDKLVGGKRKRKKRKRNKR
jgi:hypothetical protein